MTVTNPTATPAIAPLALLERKQTQRLSIATTVSVTLNALFLVLAATGMNHADAEPQIAGGGEPKTPRTVIELPSLVAEQKPLAPQKAQDTRPVEESQIRAAKTVSEVVTHTSMVRHHSAQPTAATPGFTAQPAPTETLASGTTEPSGATEPSDAQSGVETSAQMESVSASGAAGVATGASAKLSGMATDAAGDVGVVGVARGNSDFSAPTSAAGMASGGQLSGGGQPSLGSFGTGNVQEGVATGGTGAGDAVRVAGSGGFGATTHGRTSGTDGDGTGNNGATGTTGNARGGAFAIGTGGVSNPSGAPLGSDDGRQPGTGKHAVDAGSGANLGGNFGIPRGTGKANIAANGSGTTTGRVNIALTPETKPGATIHTQKMDLIERKPQPNDIQVTEPPTPNVRTVSPPTATATLPDAVTRNTVTAITDARVLAKVKPVISEAVKAENPRPVRVQFTVLADGSATFQLRNSSGNAELDAAVEAACAKYRWAAATRDGKPVVSVQNVTFDPNE